MNTEDNLKDLFSVETHAVTAVAIMLVHIVSALADHPNFDRNLLASQIQSFPNYQGVESFDRIYSALKETLLSKISKKCHE